MMPGSPGASAHGDPSTTVGMTGLSKGSGLARARPAAGGIPGSLSSPESEVRARTEMASTSLPLTAYTLTSALGQGISASLSALENRQSGLRPCDFGDADIETWIGRVDGLESNAITGSLAAYDCRNNRLARLALEQDGFKDAVADAASRVGASRVGVFVGTSTSGVGETERAYRDRGDENQGLASSYRYRTSHSLSSVAMYVRELLSLHGPAQAVSTACSSSAKVFATAHRCIESGICDAAVVGGVDSLCLMTLCGFRSLDLLSRHPCRPWDADRDGVSIGEAGGFALLEKTPKSAHVVELLGYGETCDGHHMSAPHPDGVGSSLAMGQALARAGIGAEDVDYINLHGTGTKANDRAEDKAIVRTIGEDTPCSSTKGWTGHTLGAAGITEAILTCLCVESDLIPGTVHSRAPDPELSAAIRFDNETQPMDIAISNSFGFGGSNCSLVFGKAR